MDDEDLIEAERIARSMCGHKCHTQGLNPWIEECPICGCENVDYDSNAEPIYYTFQMI